MKESSHYYPKKNSRSRVLCASSFCAISPICAIVDIHLVDLLACLLLRLAFHKACLNMGFPLGGLGG